MATVETVLSDATDRFNGSPCWPNCSKRILEMTAGNFATEEDSAKVFDALVDSTQVFRIHREIFGCMVQPRLRCEDKTLRIDRILIPDAKLIAAGWSWGPIGVELKRSGVNIGPPLAQLLDYERAVWHMPGGYNIVLDCCFLWPVEKQHETIASIMAQHRVGSVCSNKWKPLKFCLGEVVALVFDVDWSFRVGNIRCGRKAGSR